MDRDEKEVKVEVNVGEGPTAPPKQTNNPQKIITLRCWASFAVGFFCGSHGLSKMLTVVQSVSFFLSSYRGGSYTKPPIMLDNPVLQSFHYEFLQDCCLISVYIVFVLSQVF